MRQAVATMFLGDRESLNSSATAAGYLGVLPEEFVLSGHSAGGGFAAAAGGYYAVDPDNNKLNVSFFGRPSADRPGNYWIVDLANDYSGPNGWAIVSDPTASTGFLLSRNPVVSADLYRELLDRASVKGVRGRITPTRQPGAPTDVATRMRNPLQSQRPGSAVSA